ncbi:MAG: hypothetical protein R3Y53_06970 [Bacillota bacterium]
MISTTIVFAICVTALGLQQLIYGFRYRSGKAPYFLYPEYPKNYISEEDLSDYTALMGLSHYAGGTGFLLAGMLSLFVPPSFLLMLPVIIGTVMELFLCTKVKKKYGRCSLLF